MILHQLKTHLAQSEPVTREFVALMDATFKRYAELRATFLEKLPHHLLQSELVSLVNVDVKSRLFDEAFCAGIQGALKSLRRALIRLEDLREQHPGHADVVNDLPRLAALAERVEALYQKHWEFYRYQGRLSEEDLVSFLLEIDQIAYEWDTYLSGFAAGEALLETLSGQPCPDGMTPLHLTYQREGPAHYGVGSIQALLRFLDAGYRFVCTVCEVDPDAQPLTLLQVEVAEPVEVRLAVPQAMAPVYRKFLQYLFLKDMLKREALLKVVFEATSREAGRDKPPPPATLTGFQKELSAALQQLPQDGRFTVSDRTFPDDGIRVLQEFTATLDAQSIRYDALLRGDATKRKRGKAKDSDPPAAKDAARDANQPPVPPTPPAPAQGPRTDESLFSLSEKEHIAVLTERRKGN